MKRIPYVEISECQGCRSCAAICPEVFQMNEMGRYAQVINPYAGSEDCILEAMASCPVRCIRWAE